MSSGVSVRRNVGDDVLPGSLLVADLMSAPLPVVVELAAVMLADAAARGGAAPVTVDAYVLMLRRFARFASSSGVETVAGIDEVLVEDFFNAPNVRSQRRYAKGDMGDTDEPSEGTRSVRRAALRVFRSVLLACGLTVDDWTSGLSMSRRTGVRFIPVRPLTPVEVLAVRDAARNRLNETRRPALVAVSAAGAAPYETEFVTVADVNLDAGTVRVAGAVSRYATRMLPLREWQLDALAAHMRKNPNPDCRLLYPQPVPVNEFVSRYQGEALLRAYRVAGITDAKSSALWLYAANVTCAIDGLEAARDRVGLTRLDTAERLVSRVWQEKWGDTARAQFGV